MENLHRPGNTLIIVHCVDLQDLADSGRRPIFSKYLHKLTETSD